MILSKTYLHDQLDNLRSDMNEALKKFVADIVQENTELKLELSFLRERLDKLEKESKQRINILNSRLNATMKRPPRSVV